MTKKEEKEKALTKKVEKKKDTGKKEGTTKTIETKKKETNKKETKKDLIKKTENKTNLKNEGPTIKLFEAIFFGVVVLLLVFLVLIKYVTPNL